MSRRSIAGEFTRSLLGATLILGAVTGILWIVQLNHIFSQQISHVIDHETAIAKADAKKQIEAITGYVDYREGAIVSQIEEKVKTRVQEGYTQALSIFEHNRTKNMAAVQQAVVETLRVPRFFDGRGYYFIDTLEGVAVLYPSRPELEGTSVLEITDFKGQRIVEQEIRIVEEQGEGFVTGYWPRPNDPDDDVRLKISYVKRLDPYDWYIGTGEYYEDAKAEVRQDIIKRYSNFTSESGVKVFIIDESGKELVSRYTESGAGTALPELLRTEEEKQAVIKEEMAYSASNPAGYSYIRDDLDLAGEPYRTAVYIQAMPKWEWTIGVEVPVKPVKSGEEWNVSDVKRHFYKTAAEVLVLILCTSLMFIWVIRRQTLKLRNDFIAFMTFFKRAAKENILIDINHIQIQEFASMGNLANQMVTTRQEAKDALMMSNEALEVQVQERTRELQESLQILESTQDQLMQSEKLSVLGNLVAGITHEINIPVGIVRSLNSDLQDLISSVRTGMSEDDPRMIELQVLLSRMEEDSTMMEANLKRTQELVESFKDVSVDQCSGQRRTFNLKSYIDEMVLSLSARIRKGGHRVEVICDEEVEVTGFPGTLSQILTNLITNSLQHGFQNRSGGHITVEIIDGGERILMLYRDDGRGIPSRDIGSVYEPFYTTDRERRTSGLGLNIVHQLVTEKMGGTINLTSTEGRGVLFEIEFPRVQGE